LRETRPAPGCSSRVRTCAPVLRTWIAAADGMSTLRARLGELTRNLWWTWRPEVIEIFRELDPERWRVTNHNPVWLLASLTDADLEQRVADRGLLTRINFQYRRLEEHVVEDRTWASKHARTLLDTPVAYFSAEFGLHESLPLYSGGLGVLAGDYLKSASDLGIPIIGVGLYYASGYFNQDLNPDGWQVEAYGRTDLATLPLTRAAADDGSWLTIAIPCGAEMLRAGVWLTHIGRVQLLLLDSDVDGNPPHLRELTGRLYGGDELTRIRQELLLGVGGVRALRAVGVRPRVLHLNEGHSAFAVLERTRERVEEDGQPFDAAFRDTGLQTVFTTHTPVAAGHDRFPSDLVESQAGWLRVALGLDQQRFMGLGRVNPGDSNETFCMTVLALRGARQCNGVSSLHGHVSRQMWQRLFATAEARVPIGHITNGVHVLSWLAPSMKRIYDRVLGEGWTERQWDPETWEGLAGLDPAELWEAHSTLRLHLVDFVRRRGRGSVRLDPDALTIGFARRFATYKRATLLVSDSDWLERLCADASRPVQFVIAGKAHPRDDAGKDLIRRLIAMSRDTRFRGRLVFVADYDINVARHLVQGTDVWLNTPLRPLEACGTSGQKVVLNGGLNLSTLDGWWAEAFDGENGFAIGSPFVHRDWDRQWERDAHSLRETIDYHVLPLFYDRDAVGHPTRWVARMKRSVMTLAWRFNAARMVRDYVTRAYLPAAGGLTAS